MREPPEGTEPIWGGRVQRLRGAGAMIVGLGREVDRAIADGLGREGAVLGIWDRDPERVQSEIDRVRASGLVAEGRVLTDDVEGAVDDQMRGWTKIDALVARHPVSWALVDAVAKCMATRGSGSIVTVFEPGDVEDLERARAMGDRVGDVGVRCNAIVLPCAIPEVDPAKAPAIASIVVFLLGPESRLLHGQVLTLRSA